MGMPSVVVEVERWADDVFQTSRREEASTSQPIGDASLMIDGRGKNVVDEGDESGSKFDVADLRMTDKVLPSFK